MRRIQCLVVSFLLCFSLVIPCSAIDSNVLFRFEDVNVNEPFLDSLDYAVYNGFISGTSENTFSPYASLTRGQFVTILGRMVGAEIDSGVTKFVDVPEGSWYAPYVAWANEAGVVSGVSQNRFSPDSVITFEQMAVLLANYIEKTGAVLTNYTPEIEYKDMTSVANWAKASVETCRLYGLIPPDLDGNFTPSTPVTRAIGTESLVRLARATGIGVETEHIPLSSMNVTYSKLIHGEVEPNFVYDSSDIWTAYENYLWMLRNHVTEIKVSGSTGPDALMEYATGYTLWAGIMPEHGYSVGTAWDGQTAFIRIGHSKFTEEELSSYKDKALEVAVQIHDNMWATGQITKDMTQREKAWAYYNWICDNCIYDRSFQTLSYSAYGALVNKTAVCNGITAAYDILLQLEGIECLGCLSDSLNHIWTMALLDGEYCHIDATWGMSTIGDRAEYFGMTEEEAISRDFG